MFLALALAIAGAAGLWAMAHQPRIATPESAAARAVRQIRTQVGPDAELRYAEAGQKRSMCGYIGRAKGGPAVGFVSIPNRILFSDDPLPTEFSEMRQRYCPGFMQGPRMAPSSH